MKCPTLARVARARHGGWGLRVQDFLGTCSLLALHGVFRGFVGLLAEVPRWFHSACDWTGYEGLQGLVSVVEDSALFCIYFFEFTQSCLSQGLS